MVLAALVCALGVPWWTMQAPSEVLGAISNPSEVFGVVLMSVGCYGVEPSEGWW